MHTHTHKATLYSNILTHRQQNHLHNLHLIPCSSLVVRCLAMINYPKQPCRFLNMVLIGRFAWGFRHFLRLYFKFTVNEQMASDSSSVKIQPHIGLCSKTQRYSAYGTEGTFKGRRAVSCKSANKGNKNHINEGQSLNLYKTRPRKVLEKKSYAQLNHGSLYSFAQVKAVDDIKDRYCVTHWFVQRAYLA